MTGWRGITEIGVFILHAGLKDIFFRISNSIQCRKHFPWLLSGAVFYITFAIRLAFIFESGSIAVVRTPTPGMDADLYWQTARLINQGIRADQPYFEPMMCSSPLYPYWLSFWQSVFGQNMFMVRVANAVIISFGAVWLLHLIRKLTRHTWIAFFWCAVWAALPSLVFFDSTLYKVNLVLFLFMGLLTVILYDPRSSGIYPYFLKGIIAGLLSILILLLQFSTFLIIAALMAFIIFDRRLELKKRLVLLLMVTGCFSAGLLGFNLRSQFLQLRFPWFLPQKGIHFNIGFNEHADGTYARIDGIDPWPYGHNFQARMVAEAASGWPLTPTEADRYFVERAFGNILDHPGNTFRLLLKKTILFFNNYEVKGVDDFTYLKSKSRILSWLPFNHGMIVLFAGLGVAFLLETRQYRIFLLLGGMLGATLVSNLIIFISWRYRLPSLVPLTLLASYGSLSLLRKSQDLFRPAESRRGTMAKSVCYALIPMLIAAFFAFYPVIGEKKQLLHQNAVANENLSVAAEAMIKILENNEINASLNRSAVLRKALLLNRLHRHSEAYQLFSSITENSVREPIAVYHHLVYLMWLGAYDQAVALMNRANDENADIAAQVKARLRGIEKQAYRLFIENNIKSMP